MAVFLHPDKMRDVENARECFEQVSSLILHIFIFCKHFIEYLNRKKVPSIILLIGCYLTLLYLYLPLNFLLIRKFKYYTLISVSLSMLV